MDAKGFKTNNAGGIIGGISTGEEIVFRIAVKPTSSISKLQHTVDTHGTEMEIRTIGRHDPCICPRIVPVVEAMAAIVLEDHYKRQAALFV
jgi:chorismate synthase